MAKGIGKELENSETGAKKQKSFSWEIGWEAVLSIPK